MLKKTITAAAIILLTGCIPPQHHYTMPVRQPLELVDDGSQKMKQCKFECQKERTQCEIKINTDYASRPAIGHVNVISQNAEKQILNEKCQKYFEQCFKDVCGGTLK